MKAAFKMVIIMVSVIANEKLRKVRIVVGYLLVLCFNRETLLR